MEEKEIVPELYKKGYDDGKKNTIFRAYEWLDLHLSRCIECYVDDVVTTRLKEDVLYDFKHAMED